MHTFSPQYQIPPYLPDKLGHIYSIKFLQLYQTSYENSHPTMDAPSTTMLLLLCWKRKEKNAIPTIVNGWVRFFNHLIIKHSYLVVKIIKFLGYSAQIFITVFRFITFL